MGDDGRPRRRKTAFEYGINAAVFLFLGLVVAGATFAVSVLACLGALLQPPPEPLGPPPSPPSPAQVCADGEAKRQAYLHELDEYFLSNGMDIQLAIDGECGSRLVMTTVLCDRVFMYNIPPTVRLKLHGFKSMACRVAPGEPILEHQDL